jgi:transforming growth factor-beta-induced protein
MKKKHLVSIVLALVVVLLPSSFAFAQEGDIVDTAAANEDFSTLVAAVQAAGLVDALKGEGPFTVFAPVNAAFEPLAADGTLDALLADPSGDLTQILLYHVVPGKVMSSDLSDGLQADTLEGSPLTFTVSDSGAMVNDANIVAADIEVSNGVIHVIDKVLVPPAEGDMAESSEGDMAESSEMQASDEGMAPETMPVTGVGNTAIPMPMVAAAGLLGVLAVAAVIGRRRNA